MSTPRLLLWMLMACVASGCVNMEYDVWVEPDGSGRTVTRVVPAPSTGRLFEQLAGQGLAQKLREHAARIEASLKDDPNVVRFAFREEPAAAGTPASYLYELELEDMARLDEAMARVQRAMEEGGGMDGPAQRVLESSGGPQVMRLDNGNYRFRLALDPRAGAADAGTAPAAENPLAGLGQALGRAVLGQVTQETALTVRVHGAEVLGGNGQLDADKRTMQWRVPFSELVVPTQAGRVLEAEVRGTSPLLVWAALLAVPLAVLALVVMAARRRRR